MYSVHPVSANRLQTLFLSGNGLIYENGTLLTESERFSFKEQLVISEIDVERLRGERLTNTTFAANIGNCPGRPAIHISTEFVKHTRS